MKKEENDLTLFAIELRVIKPHLVDELRARLRVRGRVDDWYTVKRWDFPNRPLTDAETNDIWLTVVNTGQENVIQLIGLQMELET